ncbi:hypothetical protein HDU93_002632 [Gonapodya sp. JEL0774]|nr:hypothetical protein HDU93_002632 [Gonapodya sp. JEL0774]
MDLHNGNEPKASESDRDTRLAYFSYGKAAADLDALLEHLGVERCVVVAHDWGSLLAQRFAVKYPARLDRLILLTIPYLPPPAEYVPLAVQAQSLPILRYQLYFSTDKAEHDLNSRTAEFVDLFFRPGGEGAGVSAGLLARVGPEEGNGLFDLFKDVPPSTLMSDKEKQAYVSFYRSIGGLNGPLQWYRMGEASFDEFKDVERRLDVETLFVGAEHPFLEAMKLLVPKLTLKVG